MQLNVARDSPARLYTVGVERNGMLEDDLAFYLVATGGAYAEESFVGALLSTNWIGYIGIGPKDVSGKRDVAIAFRGTQVLVVPASHLRIIFSAGSCPSVLVCLLWFCVLPTCTRVKQEMWFIDRMHKEGPPDRRVSAGCHHLCLKIYANGDLDWGV